MVIATPPSAPTAERHTRWVASSVSTPSHASA